MEIARSSLDVKRMIAQSAMPVVFIACTRSSLHDVHEVELYVLRVDTRLGIYRGLGSTCVTSFDLIAGSLTQVRQGEAWSRAAAQAEDRIARLQAAEPRAAA